jgi:hypothetical protein
MTKKIYTGRPTLEGIGARGAGGGGSGGGIAPRIERAQAAIERSMQERGGYPTRGGKPKMTKMQERMEERKANPPAQKSEAERAWRKYKFGSFRKGGLVTKSTSKKSHVDWSC